MHYFYSVNADAMCRVELCEELVN